MNTRPSGHDMPRVLLAAGLLILAMHQAPAVELSNLRNQGVDALYGSYAPGGDCTREPRITVDAAGFTFDAAGQRTRTRRIEYAVSYMGQDYQGRSAWFFPFVVNDDDLGPLLMTFNADERDGALGIEATDSRRPLSNPIQAALVRHTPYLRCSKRTPVAESITPSAVPEVATPAALDWNTLPALVGKYPGDFDLFGPGSIATNLKALLGNRLDTLRRNLLVAGPLARAGSVYYLSGNAPHQGGSDQAYVLLDAARHAVQVGLWERGKLRVYADPGVRIAPPPAIRRWLAQSPPEDAVAEPGVPWQLRAVAGRPPLALGLAAGSIDIKSLSVFCERGRPLLAMLLRRAPKAGPLTLSWVFRGGLVNLPMRRGNAGATLWLADLGSSTLPQWLASQRGEAYLRINGVMQGSISLAGAAAASTAALRRCTRRR